jgi:SNF2 family DNA or RNA helicase
MNGPRGVERLQDLVRATSLRRTMASNGESLGLQPPIENVEFVDLDSKDRALYGFFQQKSYLLAREAAKKRGKKKKTAGPSIGKGDDNILALMSFLRLVCNYGEHMLSEKAVRAWKMKDPDAVDWQMMQRSKQQCSRCNVLFQSVDEPDTLPCGHEACPSCVSEVQEADEGDDEVAQACNCCRGPQRARAVVRSGDGWNRSAKVGALIRNLREEQRPGVDGASQKR